MNWFFPAFLAAVVWGLSYAITEKVVDRVPVPIVAFWGSLFTCASFAIVLLATGGGFSPWRMFGSGVSGMFFATEACFVVAQLCILYAVKNSGNATAASIIEVSYPLWVFVFSAAIFGEVKLNLQGVVGGLFVLAGTIIFQTSTK